MVTGLGSTSGNTETREKAASLHSVGEREQWLRAVVREEGRTGYIWICFERSVNRTGREKRDKEKRRIMTPRKIEVLVVVGVTGSLALRRCELGHTLGEVTM